MTKFKASMKPIMILQKLEAAKTKKAQEKVLSDAWATDSEEFFLGLEMALDPNLRFGLVSAPEIQDMDDGDPGTFAFKDFLEMAQRLSTGELNGDTAKRAIVEAAQRCNISEWNLWYRRILLKSLPYHLPMDIVTATLTRLTTH